jgi:hypothetical protein
VADVEIAIGLGWKARLNDGVAELFGTHILGDLIAEKVAGRVGFWICVRHCCDSLLLDKSYARQFN